MAKSKSGASRTVVKQEENESASQWIECRARMNEAWKELPAIPSVASRRALAMAHRVDPRRVHKWFSTKKIKRKSEGVLDHPEDGYELLVGGALAEQPSSSTTLNAIPPLDNMSSPNYLSMSSPLPQTPLDMYNDFPVAVSAGPSLVEDQVAHSFAHPFSLEFSHPKSPSLPLPSALDTHHKTDLAIKNEIVDAAPLSDQQAPASGSRKGRRVILRVSSGTKEGSSIKSGKASVNPETTTATAKPKKKRRVKKAPKVEAVDEDGSSGPTENAALDPAGSMMPFPQTFPPGFCAPYFTYINPAMAFGTGMTGTQNLPPHSLGNIMYNPFTGEPLVNNIPAQFSAFPGQPSQPPLFNGNMSVGQFGQMFPQVPASIPPGPNMHIPGPNPMDQNVFAGNFQGFQSGMPTDGMMNLPNPPEPTMSLIDFLNEPLDAGWTYP